MYSIVFVSEKKPVSAMKQTKHYAVLWHKRMLIILTQVKSDNNAVEASIIISSLSSSAQACVLLINMLKCRSLVNSYTAQCIKNICPTVYVLSFTSSKFYIWLSAHIILTIISLVFNWSMLSSQSLRNFHFIVLLCDKEIIRLLP